VQRWYLRDAVIGQGALRANSAGDSPTPDLVSRRWLLTTIALATLAVVVAASVVWALTQRPPGDDSLEAGFARDMIVHHDQAVAMALSIRYRTADPRLKSLATDIILTQQNQIGQMLGWLNVWDLPATGSDPPMAWMGHPVTGRMPGMATPEELADLERLSGDAADAEFLRLMIRHHQAAIPMAEAALAQSDVGPVHDLAGSIIASQQIEIAAMEDLLAEKTGTPSRP
jgi:uncharacterized protein (DUF305 family)